VRNHREIRRWYERGWVVYENVKDNPADIDELLQALEDAVHRQLMSDVSYCWRFFIRRAGFIDHLGPPQRIVELTVIFRIFF
jgi:hypothetical protein